MSRQQLRADWIADRINSNGCNNVRFSRIISYTLFYLRKKKELEAEKSVSLTADNINSHQSRGILHRQNHPAVDQTVLDVKPVADSEPLTQANNYAVPIVLGVAILLGIMVLR